MPFDPPPLQPSLAERYYIERQEEELRHAAAQEAHRQQVWWESLSDEEREEHRQAEARKQAEARERDEQRHRAEELRRAAHRERIEAFEGDHGGPDHVAATRASLAADRNAIKDPQPVSPGGTLIVLLVFALIPGCLLAAIFQSYGAGIIVAECLAILGWGLWLKNRDDRRRRIEVIGRNLAELSRQTGCGVASCKECYPDLRVREAWARDLHSLGVKSGCGYEHCRDCYPAST